MFQVAAGRVVAHWGDTSGRGQFEPLVSGLSSEPGTQDFAPALTRKTYGPGADDGDRPARGPAAIRVEAGSVVVDIAEPNVATVVRSSLERLAPIQPTVSSSPITLGPGDVLTVTEPARIETRNDAASPATVLVLSLASQRVASLGGSRPAASPGLDLRPLAGGQATVGDTDRYSVSIGRAVLSPGTGLASHIVGALELVFVESGSLALTVGGRTAWTRQLNQTATAVDIAATLGAGTGFSVPAGATVDYRNDGGDAVSLILVTIVPVLEPDR
jgi:hypothetical protein